MEDPKALEYIEVLDRKSQRLKKLTEDLVEASKASTGAPTVNKERLVHPASGSGPWGSTRRSLKKAASAPVCAPPDHELYVEADGRHLCRVIDNLLGNARQIRHAGHPRLSGCEGVGRECGAVRQKMCPGSR